MNLTLSEKISIFKSLNNNIIFKLFRTRNSYPIVVFWIMTYKCNLKCKHCNYWQKNIPLDINKLNVISEKLQQSSIPVINLSGGEPLIIPTIMEIISDLKKSGKILRINTNAYLLDRFADELIKNNVDSIAVSVDFPVADIHDKHRQMSGLFEKVIETLSYIRKNRRREKPHITVRCVVMKQNIELLEDYIELFKPKVDEISFQPIHNDESKHAVSDTSNLFDDSDEEKVTRIIKQLTDKYSFLNNTYFRSFPEFLFHRDAIQKKALDFCLFSLFNYMSIQPDGCCNTCKCDLGSIYENEIKDLWSDERRNNFLKQLVSDGCCSTPCWLNSNRDFAGIPIHKIFKSLIKVMR